MSRQTPTTMQSQSELDEGMIGFASTDNKVVMVERDLVIELAPKNETL